MRRALVAIATALMFLGLLAPPAQADDRPARRNHLVYADHFNTLRPAWSHRANSCATCVRVRHGKLILSMRHDTADHYWTGHVGTLGHREFTYGYVEVRAKFPALRGAHSAAWLQTTEDYIPGQAEIDYAENYGRPTVWHNVYWRAEGMLAGEFLDAQRTTRVPAARWHTYGVDWRPDSYVFFIDGDRVARITGGLSARPKFLVLSIKQSAWEFDQFQPDRLREYRARFAWLRVWR